MQITPTGAVTNLCKFKKMGEKISINTAVEPVQARGSSCQAGGLTAASLLFQNKVLTVDGVKVKLQVRPHGPGAAPAVFGAR